MFKIRKINHEFIKNDLEIKNLKNSTLINV